MTWTVSSRGVPGGSCSRPLDGSPGFLSSSPSTFRVEPEAAGSEGRVPPSPAGRGAPGEDDEDPPETCEPAAGVRPAVAEVEGSTVLLSLKNQYTPPQTAKSNSAAKTNTQDR